jgi:chromosomal replication initiation ATPase DnaA
LQLSFSFPFQEKYSLADFIVSSCNQAAFGFVEKFNPIDIKSPKIFAINGNKKSGKTYLANIWSQKFSAEFLNLDELENVNLIKRIKAQSFYIIEDIDEIKNQELLLQIFNLASEKSAFLLLTSTLDLHQMNCAIKDLNSRLKNVFQLEISKPDDDLIKMLLIKTFAAKQLNVEMSVIDFLVKNLDRSFAAVFDAVKLLERYSLEKKRNITIPLVKEALNLASNSSN